MRGMWLVGAVVTEGSKVGGSRGAVSRAERKERGGRSMV